MGPVRTVPVGERDATLSDRTTRLLDADSDGLVDAVAATRGGVRWWRNLGEAGWATPQLAVSPQVTGVDLGAADVHLADMTGDGAADLVRVRSGRVEYWPSLGNGHFGARVLMRNSPRIRNRAPWATVVLVDLDGDGCADVVCLDTHGVTIAQNQNGTGFADARTLALGLPPTPGTVRPVNMGGEATAALLWTTPVANGNRYVRWHAPRSNPAYLLTTVNNGAGLVTTLGYRSAIEDLERDRQSGRDSAWTTNFPFPYVVVGSLVERDAVSGRVTEIEYRYHEAHFEASQRRFEGFRATERITRGDASRADSRDVYAFAMAQERAPGNGPEHALLNGLLERIETFSADGTTDADRPLRIETSRHGLTVLETLPDRRVRVFVHVAEHRRDDTERTDDVRTEVVRYVYDHHGNVVREERRGGGMVAGVAAPEHSIVHETDYAVSATRYLVDKPARATVRDESGALLDEHRTYYDGPDFVGLPLGQVDRGLITCQEELVLDRASFDAHYASMDAAPLGYHEGHDADGTSAMFAYPRRAAYDGHGLAVATRDPLDVQTVLTHDPAGLFRIALDDAHGHTEFEYEAGTAQIIATTLADGSTTRFRYDAQGRVLAGALPGQDLDDPVASYSYDETTVPHRRTTRIRLGDGDHVENVTYFDGSGKEYQQRVTVSPGTVLVSGTFARNPWGDPIEEQEPTFASSLDFGIPAGPVASRRFAYDGLGRVVRTVNFNDGVSTASFEPFAVTTHDANSNDHSPANVARGRADVVHREEFDSLRRLTRIVDTGQTGELEAVDYVIGSCGELLEIRGAAGQVRFAYSYDRRGCRLSIRSAETGLRTVWYDARKRPVRTLDGNQHDLLATWDDAVRLQVLCEHDPVNGDRVLERYVYDTQAQHALGRLALVEYDGGTQRFNYDTAGRLLTRTYTFDGLAGEEETLAYEYDPLGRTLAVVHPGGQRVQRHLTANGWLTGIDGVLDEIEYDPRGLPVRMAYSNGVESVIAYTSGPGRVSHRRTTSRAGTVLEDVAYSYDAAEQLLGANDAVPGGLGTRTYTYDPLGQLTLMAYDDDGAPATRAYDYDGRNLLSNGEAGLEMSYDPLRPDCLSAITANGQPTFPVAHDAGGNLSALPGMAFKYNAKNELVHLDTDDGLIATYCYDHLGMRVSKTVTKGAATHVVRYLGDQAEIRDGVRSVIVTAAGLRLAVLTAGATRFFHESPLGTTSFFTDETGERIGGIDIHPFGGEARRDGDIDFACYSLHPIDPESGLVYMRRRYYAPVIGRFLTPDLMALFQPEAFLHSPAGLHLYAYVANDPTNRTDRNGMSFWSFVGSVVGVVVGVIVGLLIVAAIVATGGLAGIALGVGLALAASLLVTGVSYIIASNVDPNSGFGQFMRGFMIGFNAGMNGVLAAAIFGPVVGIAIGVINFLATFDGIAKNSVYQGILGWSSWFMPMSWGATGLGLVFYAVNLLVAGLTFQQWDAVKIDKLAIDWKTGSIVMVGGLIHGPTAFDMGNFVFMNPNYVDGSTPDRTYDAVLAHETGHTLAVAAFGTAFGLADLINENVLGAGANDYGEQIAESHANRPGPERPTIPMWG